MTKEEWAKAKPGDKVIGRGSRKIAIIMEHSKWLKEYHKQGGSTYYAKKTPFNVYVKYDRKENPYGLSDFKDYDYIGSSKTKVEKTSACSNRCNCSNPNLVTSSTSFGYSPGDTFQFCRTCGNER